MNSIKIALALLSLILVLSLLLPGCDELITEVNNTTLIDSTLGIGCFDCHSDEDNILLRPKGQYLNSAHASDTLLDRFHLVNGSLLRVNECGRQCHSHEGFIQTFDSLSVANPSLSVIGCFTCHMPHTGDYGQWDVDSLRAMREFIFLTNDSVYSAGNSNMCAHCHQAPDQAPPAAQTTDVILDAEFGPHFSGQADLFKGTGGFRFTAADYPNLDVHYLEIEKRGNDGCLTCHYGNSIEPDGIGYQFGEHTFRLTEVIDPDTLRFTGNCIFSGCHGDTTTIYSDADNTLRSIDSMLTVLEDSLKSWGYLDPLDASGISFISGDTLPVDAARILYNYLLIQGDGSRGVHNPVYAQVLLLESLQQFDLLPPKADFSVSTIAGCAPLTVDFTDESHGSITTWNWGFGDNLGISSSADTSYTYDTAGIYNVSLSISGPGGADSEVKSSLIQVFEPQAAFAASETSACDSVTVTFTDNSPGDITAWLWDFGDGVGTSVLQNPDYTFDSVGSYTISLTTTDSCGQATLIVPNMIVIAGAVPVPDFSASLTDTDTLTVITFTDLTPEEVAVWDWDFGDGTSSPLQNPAHQYLQLGTYTVSLTVTNGCGTAQATKTDYILIQ